MINDFKNFGISQALLSLLSEKRISVPTEIQGEVIPKIMKGEDVIAQSRTGTGKTISYIIPLLENIHKKKDKILVIAPTKELARQIFDEFNFFARDLKLIIKLLIGGESIEKSAEKNKGDFDIIVGVPGRVLKLVDSGVLKLSQIKKLVIDEIDFLVDMGFKNDLNNIFELCKNNNQILIFSATLSRETKKMLDLAKNQRFASRVHSKNKLPDTISNYFFPLQEEETRDSLLLKIIENINPYLCIIFVRTKKESNWLYGLLKENKYLVGFLNGDLTATQRKREMDKFRKLKVQYLVSTDLASRGLDIEGINYIINYNLPVNELDYLHRAGRTGRVEESGIVYSICNELDEGYLKKYAYDLDFVLKPLQIKNGKITEIRNYIGVKPRFNLSEKEKIKKINENKSIVKKRGEKNAKKERRGRPKK